jgi:hypothetical protein
MSGIAAVSGQISSVSTASFMTTGASAAGALGAGATGGTGAADGLGQAGQAAAAVIAGLDASATGGLPAGLSVQTSSLIASAQPNANIQNMAALLLSLLLSKSNDESKDKDDPWKMLAGMAMLGMLAQQNQSVTMTQSSASVSQAYGAAGASAAAGATVNVQG